MKGTAEQRFWAKVQRITDSCWYWLGAIGGQGYGNFWNGEGYVRAHRFSYELVKGPIPEGLTLDHLCMNKICVNPYHLEAVTNEENIRRGFRNGLFDTPRFRVSKNFPGYHHNKPRALKDFCIKGHPFSGSNLFISSDGKRRCRTCVNERERKYKAQRRLRLSLEKS